MVRSYLQYNQAGRFWLDAIWCRKTVAITHASVIRADCRAAVKARFTVDRMADRYVSLYRSLLKKT